MNTELANVLQKHQSTFHRVVNFDPAKDRLLHMDFTGGNNELTTTDISDTEKFSMYINQKLLAANARYGVGGYGENRILYRRSNLFNGVEPRSIHLGVDIWGPVGTTVYAPLGGMVHSLAFNDHFGDYGATIILQHQLDTIQFHTLYGHISLADLANVMPGNYVNRGQVIAHFGPPAENGNWPPHLHFQVINDLRLREGDYPGVSTISESGYYLDNCPDADLILDMTKYAG